MICLTAWCLNSEFTLTIANSQEANLIYLSVNGSDALVTKACIWPPIHHSYI